MFGEIQDVPLNEWKSKETGDIILGHHEGATKMCLILNSAMVFVQSYTVRM